MFTRPLLRITAGRFKNQTIASPNLSSTHPMGSRERLALMNAISAKLDFDGAVVLDAFAGTGLLGFEALSRGARQVVFIENHPKAVAVLRQNIDKINKICYNNKIEPLPSLELIPKSVQYYSSSHKLPSLQHLEKLQTFNPSPPAPLFDLIFIDPPYDQFDLATFAPLFSFLKPGGLLALSHPQSFSIDQLKAFPLGYQTTLKHAASRLSLFRA